MSDPKRSLDLLESNIKDQVRALDVSAIVATTTAQGVITYVNKKFCDLSEYSEEQLIGKTHSIINSGYHPESFFVDMWQTITSGNIWRGEVCNRSQFGKIYWVDTTIVPFLGLDQRAEKYIAIRYDISQRKEAEKKLDEERKKLIESEKMASIGIMASGIAHELGNPLGAIRGRLEMIESMFLQDQFQSEFAQKSVEKMIREVDRMTKIIRGLKKYSRDGAQDKKELFNFNQLIGDILEVSHEICLKNNIEVKRTDLELPIMIMGRETEMGQVIVNLFNNAIDAVKGTETPVIEICVKEYESLVELLIIDSGLGVKEDILNKIFTPFFTTKEVGQGTGLGLSICRTIVEDHDGTLSYEPIDQKSCFKVILPKG